jgi:DNA-binding protein H-NS
MGTPKKARSLEEIEAEIRQLQEEASAVRDAEKAEVVQRMKHDISLYKITAHDLGLQLQASTTPTGKQSRSSPKLPSSRKTYSDGHGNTYLGRGPKPSWLKEALANGKSMDDFLNKD